MPTSERPIPEISAAEAHRLLTEGKAVLVDVREPDEYIAECIPQSTLVPLSNFSADYLPPCEGKKLIIHCRSGGRSGKACVFMLTSGATDVWNLAGGILAWKEAGFETVSGRKPKPIPGSQTAQTPR